MSGESQTTIECSPESPQFPNVLFSWKPTEDEQGSVEAASANLKKMLQGEAEPCNGEGDDGDGGSTPSTISVSSWVAECYEGDVVPIKLLIHVPMYSGTPLQYIFHLIDTQLNCPFRVCNIAGGGYEVETAEFLLRLPENSKLSRTPKELHVYLKSCLYEGTDYDGEADDEDEGEDSKEDDIKSI